MGIAPDEIYAKVAPVARTEGVPDYVWESIAHMESGFNPKALGDSGKSFGLFQLYTAGGQGDPYKNNPTVLFDPAMNAQVAMPSIAQAYRTAKAQGMEDGPELAAWVAGHSGHPGYSGASNSIAAKAIDAVKRAAESIFGGDGGVGELNQAAADQDSEDVSLTSRLKALLTNPVKSFAESIGTDTLNLYGERMLLFSLGLLFILVAIFLIADFRGSEA